MTDNLALLTLIFTTINCIEWRRWQSGQCYVCLLLSHGTINILNIYISSLYNVSSVLPAEARFPRGAGGVAAGQAEAGVPPGEAGHLPHNLLHPALPLHQLGDSGSSQPHPGQHSVNR